MAWDSRIKGNAKAEYTGWIVAIFTSDRTFARWFPGSLICLRVKLSSTPRPRLARAVYTMFNYRAVFNWVSKVISELLWFIITSLRDWFKVLAPLFQPIRSETKTNCGSRVHIFPRFVSATCNYFEFWLVYWIVSRPFWLAKVITLVLVLRHSFEKRSIVPVIYCDPVISVTPKLLLL